MKACPILGAVVSGCATFALLAQQPTENPSSTPEPATAAIEVADTEQFCPVTWRLLVTVPDGREATTVQTNVARIERKEADGTWRSQWCVVRANGKPDEGAYPTAFTPGSEELGGPCGDVKPSFLFKIPSRGSLAFLGQITHWNVIGYAGTYRIVVDCHLPARRLDVVSPEFRILAAGVQGAELTKAQLEESETWKAFTNHFAREGFFSDHLTLDVPPCVQQVPGSAAGNSFHTMLLDNPLLSGNALRRVNVPDGLRQRLDLWRLVVDHSMAWSKSAGVERDAAMARVIGDCAVLGRTPGFVGAFARLQGLAYVRAHGTKAEFDVQLAAAKQDRELLEAARFRVAKAMELGLFADEVEVVHPRRPLLRRSEGVQPPEPRPAPGRK